MQKAATKTRKSHTKVSPSEFQPTSHGNPTSQEAQNDVFQYISCHPRLPYAAKVSIAERERQSFHDEHRRKECLTEKQELWKNT